MDCRAISVARVASACLFSAESRRFSVLAAFRATDEKNPSGTVPLASFSFISCECVSMASCRVLNEFPCRAASIHSRVGSPPRRFPDGSGTITTYVVASRTSFSFTFLQAVPPGLHAETRNNPSSRCANCRPVMFTPAVQSNVTSSSVQVGVESVTSSSSSSSANDSSATATATASSSSSSTSSSPISFVSPTVSTNASSFSSTLASASSVTSTVTCSSTSASASTQTTSRAGLGVAGSASIFFHFSVFFSVTRTPDPPAITVDQHFLASPWTSRPDPALNSPDQIPPMLVSIFSSAADAALFFSLPVFCWRHSNRDHVSRTPRAVVVGTRVRHTVRTALSILGW
mmetsp:Transcript_132/g.397  ORF Transcript_132/g.397 Transcript_132/m.397 type:complete len:345 (+) Transcript_132:1489-2523(+)